MASSIIPIIGYDDQRGALKWLAEAFDFTESVVHEREGRIVHAEMRYGEGSFMLAPRHVDGASVYVVVDDPDAHHARAVAAGAKIVRPLADMDYGSREYGAQDLEGNTWHFGTYRPETD